MIRMTGAAIAAWIAILLVVAGTATFVVALNSQLLPWQTNIERDVFTQSRQYVQAKQEFLMGLNQDMAQLEAQPQTTGVKAQMTATLNRMETEAQLIKADQVPPPVIATLNRYGRTTP